MWILVMLGIFGALWLSALYSGAETSAYSASRIRLRARAEEGDCRAVSSLSLLTDLPALITTILIGNNLAIYAGSFLLTTALAGAGLGRAELVATAVLTPLYFLFAEVLPKRIAQVRPVHYALASVRFCRGSMWAFYPLGILLNAVAAGWRRLLERLGFHVPEQTGRARLAEHVEMHAADEVLSDTQHEMAQRIMTIHDLTVDDVMIPLRRAVLIREEATCREAAGTLHEAGLRRAPICDRGGRPTGEEITLNRILRNPASLDQPVGSLARECLSIDRQTPVTKTLQRLKAEHARLALATGKAGRAVGVITVSDLVSRVVGTMRL